MREHVTFVTAANRPDGYAEAKIAFAPLGSLGVPNSADAVSVSVLLAGSASDALARAWELTSSRWPVLFSTPRPPALKDGVRFDAERVHCPPPPTRNALDFVPVRWSYDE